MREGGPFVLGKHRDRGYRPLEQIIVKGREIRTVLFGHLWRKYHDTACFADCFFLG